MQIKIITFKLPVLQYIIMMNVTILLKSKLNFYWPTEKLTIEGKKTVFKKENYLVMPHEKNQIN